MKMSGYDQLIAVYIGEIKEISSLLVEKSISQEERENYLKRIKFFEKQIEFCKEKKKLDIQSPPDITREIRVCYGVSHEFNEYKKKCTLL